ncbi:dephospho-CoA kinase [Persicimonas caeni]|uniref:Dephospho-CoA kinase n=1 Tax=Persicimonas caeni TaxID=2292766 RepID=A0A4Y6Q0V5_PERCE|nr:dephospho-CoA kinase [Persicimonas caeni]QDG54214.1 dephospho-CoA kinase [Persicimonas caeni]QED35435.1 dephospho-CoA kinase [Persicimonas caeni]
MPQDDTFVIVGLTGGIASGKSTVANMMAELGARIIDADVIARKIVEPGEPAWEDIREAFGDEVLRDDDTLDREALGKVVFGDREARKKLESITHPRIGQRMMERAQQIRSEGHHWVIYDAALIVENGIHEWLDSLIVVAADRDVQIKRVMERDNMSHDEAVQRLDAQMPLEEKIAVADYVIDNNGTLQQTREQVEQIYQQIEEGVRTRGTAKPADEDAQT